MIQCSVLILAKNEEASLPACLESLTGFDDVIVVDSASSDRTVALAEGVGARVLQFAWDGQYPKKKQWALENADCRHNWVLMLDADERVTPELAAQIEAAVTGDEPHAAYDVNLSYVFLGRELRHGHRVTKRILLRRDRAHFPIVDDLDVANMWEVEGHYQPIVEGSVGKLDAELLHRDEDSLYDYFGRHNRYSDWEAVISGRKSAGVNANRSLQGRLFAKVPAKPVLFFLYAYVLRAGWRDGRAGLHYALFQSFYYWQIGLKKIELSLKGESRPAT